MVFGDRLDDVDQPLVDPHLEVLARVLVLVRAPHDREAVLLGRQRDRTSDRRLRAHDRLDDLARRLVDDLVVERLQADADAAHARRALLEDLDDAAGADGAATLADGEPQTLVHRDRLAELAPS